MTSSLLYSSLKSIELEAQSVRWAQINKNIATSCWSCSFCEAHNPSQRREPLMPTPLPGGLWKMVGMDMFEFDNAPYLGVIDFV